MVSKDTDRFVLWPLYFDRNVSRRNGRRVAKKQAVDGPTVDALAKAAQSLGLHPEVEKTATHPSQPWKPQGRVLVDAKHAKTEVLEQIARVL